ncbi:hypothetical protein [Pseudomonas simiae]|uniref:Uncharacterized protein n=1 Tax=Pseudomonas simiae TaxID=321846 RepID=U1TEA9_9PSED|nr:hypothetical protein [Pseudomonas simiae]ERH56499.1 hypothetical protein O204_04570 [Pseudomonas simiae]MBD8737928.1 hypothetical protein [Pseudomonas fluorescens]TKK11247.1 hypothetical protein PflCFBP13514_04985 [Pseudomonas fluorescens]VVN70992.1 hypothetical protein PS706_00431 [Pseudomonas fluorescens]
MPTNPDTTIQIADLLTLLWENQLGMTAALEELGLWVQSQGGGDAHAKALEALEALDRNASAIADGIMALRGH